MQLDDAHGDGEQPGPHGRLAAELGQPACDDQEHVLDHIVERGRGGAQATRAAPHELEVLAVHRHQLRAWRSGGLGGGGHGFAGW